MTECKEILGVFDAGSNHWAGDGFPVRKLFPSSGVDKQIDPRPTYFTPSNRLRGVGDVQWMTAASGIVHEEVHDPEFATAGRCLSCKMGCLRQTNDRHAIVKD